MHPLTSEVLSRFHRTLVEEIQSSRPEYLTGAFTVAEIYQNLVPYRTHRDRIGVEMNGDYEDALLRLLAGEGDYLVLESEHARRELQGELESSNPNTGLFREFAAADVRLNRERLPSSLSRGEDEGPTPSPNDLFGDTVSFDISDETPIPVEDLAPGNRPSSPPRATPDGTESSGPHDLDREPKPPAGWGFDDEAPPMRSGAESRTLGEESGAPAAASATPGACRWCREPLPRRETLNYCPFCGANAHLVPCANCGEELEPEWRFCVACGTEATDSA